MSGHQSPPKALRRRERGRRRTRAGVSRRSGALVARSAARTTGQRSGHGGLRPLGRGRAPAPVQPAGDPSTPPATATTTRSSPPASIRRGPAPAVAAQPTSTRLAERLDRPIVPSLDGPSQRRGRRPHRRGLLGGCRDQLGCESSPTNCRHPARGAPDGDRAGRRPRDQPPAEARPYSVWRPQVDGWWFPQPVSRHGDHPTGGRGHGWYRTRGPAEVQLGHLETLRAVRVVRDRREAERPVLASPAQRQRSMWCSPRWGGGLPGTRTLRPRSS